MYVNIDFFPESMTNFLCILSNRASSPNSARSVVCTSDPSKAFFAESACKAFDDLTYLSDAVTVTIEENAIMREC